MGLELVRQLAAQGCSVATLHPRQQAGVGADFRHRLLADNAQSGTWRGRNHFEPQPSAWHDTTR